MRRKGPWEAWYRAGGTKYEMKYLAVTDERGEKVVAVKGGLVLKVTVPPTKFKLNSDELGS